MVFWLFYSENWKISVKSKVKLIKLNSYWYMHNRQSKNSWHLPLQILTENTQKTST